MESIGKDTLKAMASAGQDHQVKMLQSLGLSSTLITGKICYIYLYMFYYTCQIYFKNPKTSDKNHKTLELFPKQLSFIYFSEISGRILIIFCYY